MPLLRRSRILFASYPALTLRPCSGQTRWVTYVAPPVLGEGHPEWSNRLQTRSSSVRERDSRTDGTRSGLAYRVLIRKRMWPDSDSTNAGGVAEISPAREGWVRAETISSAGGAAPSRAHISDQIRFYVFSTKREIPHQNSFSYDVPLGFECNEPRWQRSSC